MTFDKLYKSLVVGGAMLAGSCAATDGATRTMPEPVSAEVTVAQADDAQRCDDICETLSGGEVNCPDIETGTTNCCWLMSKPHPSCPS